MKRLLIIPALLFMAACEPAVSEAEATNSSTEEETWVPAAGKKYKVTIHSHYVREWQHPTTGCWYLLGTGDASGITPLNDANGQICDPMTQNIAR